MSTPPLQARGLPTCVPSATQTRSAARVRTGSPCCNTAVRLPVLCAVACGPDARQGMNARCTEDHGQQGSQKQFSTGAIAGVDRQNYADEGVQMERVVMYKHGVENPMDGPTLNTELDQFWRHFGGFVRYLGFPQVVCPRPQQWGDDLCGMHRRAGTDACKCQAGS